MIALNFGNWEGNNGIYQPFCADIHFNKNADFQYDGKELPLKSNTFDIIFSDQVMEHCFHIDDFYREAARVLGSDGVMQVNFPHRFVPFDSHSRTWFRHWFCPSDPVRALNWKTKGYHKRIAKKYFSEIEDVAWKVFVDYDKYEGPKLLRRIANWIPGFFGLSYFRQVHWEMKGEK